MQIFPRKSDKIRINHVKRAAQGVYVIKKEFPKIHFYDHDVVNIYTQTCHWMKDSWKSGTAKNGFCSKYFNYPENEKVNQFEAIFSTFFLVYSNRMFPVA